MKKWLISIFIFILIIGGLAGAGLYFSRVVISKGDNVYIKTAFRPMEKYTQEGTYFFPEKLIFWNKESFTLFRPEIEKEYNTIITFSLPELPQFKDKTAYELSYELRVNYKISNEKQVELFKENKYKSFIDTFQNWLNSRDQHLVLEKLLAALNEKKSFDLEPILESAKKELYQEIQKKYQGESIVLTESQISHSLKKVPNFEMYFERYEIAKKHDQEKLKLKSKEEKESMESQAVWNSEKRKIEQNIEELKMYGKLFKEYPEALNYLYLQKLSDRVNIIVAPKDTKSLFAPLFPNKNGKKETSRAEIPEPLKNVLKNNLEKNKETENKQTKSDIDKSKDILIPNQ